MLEVKLALKSAVLVAILQPLLHAWLYFLRLDEGQVVTGIWWQSQLQGELCRRYGDILINDNTYARNQNGYPLNIGIIIDGHGCSRNAWYALHAREDVIHHDWVFNCHLQSASFPPEGLISDRHRSIIASACRILPLTPHFYCIHHLDGNVEANVCRGLGSQWSDFSKMFWRHTVQFPLRSSIGSGIYLSQPFPLHNITYRKNYTLAGLNGHGLTRASNSPVVSAPMVRSKEKTESTNSLGGPRKVQSNYSMVSTSAPKVRVSRI